MTDAVKIYHNPRCSKSRDTLSLLKSNGVEPEVVRRALESVRSVPGRAEVLDTHTPYKVILDYSHSPDALENILSTVRQFARGRVISESMRRP